MQFALSKVEKYSKMKQQYAFIHSSAKMTPIKASTESNELESYKNNEDENKKESFFRIGELERTSNLRKFFIIKEAFQSGAMNCIQKQKPRKVLKQVIF